MAKEWIMSLEEVAFHLGAHLMSKYPLAFGLLLRQKIARSFAEIEEYALLSHADTIGRSSEALVPLSSENTNE